MGADTNRFRGSLRPPPKWYKSTLPENRTDCPAEIFWTGAITRAVNEAHLSLKIRQAKRLAVKAGKANW